MGPTPSSRRFVAIRLLSLLLSGAVLAALARTAAAAVGDTTLVSRAPGTAGAKGNGDSSLPSISGTGRFVAFRSFATNLDPADRDPTEDVYVRNLQTGATTLASRATGPAGQKGNRESSSPAVSADGRFVAFLSVSTNLDPADGDPVQDVYVRDLETSTTTLVSRASGVAGAKANAGALTSPPILSISADGRFVAFASLADNLDPAAADSFQDVFVRDLTEHVTMLANRASGAAGAKGDAGASSPALSADGRVVGFNSAATNLHPDDRDPVLDVFVRDLRAHTTTLASRAAGVAGVKGDFTSVAPSVSADGRFVAFQSQASNLDREDADYIHDVYVRDLQANATSLASRQSGVSGAKGGARSLFPSISADGRVVAFLSSAANLVFPDDTDEEADVFARDLRAGATALVSRASGTAGAKGVTASSSPSVSGDGRFVAFSSTACNLHPDDVDVKPDVFVREVGLPLATADGPPAAATCPAGGNSAPTRLPTPPTTPASLGEGHCANRLTGTSLRDLLHGTTRGDLIVALAGNDVLDGREGEDCLYGDTGRDRLSGGSGDDVLDGGAGPDRLSADAGNDRLVGGPGNDSITGGRGRSSYSGGPGRDRIDSVNGRRERVSCGSGRADTARVDHVDRVRGCERVLRARRPGRRLP